MTRVALWSIIQNWTKLNKISKKLAIVGPVYQGRLAGIYYNGDFVGWIDDDQVSFMGGRIKLKAAHPDFFIQLEITLKYIMCA